ncbi:hypothetical protein [Enterobacter sp.]|uniref:hypothetical protein n=1 Tax=Enterobacter sp. TaxID=42895 RepID=UPI00296FB66E|nr:hypothetical protein [Enterobacter sp.]
MKRRGDAVPDGGVNALSGLQRRVAVRRVAVQMPYPAYKGGVTVSRMAAQAPYPAYVVIK